MLTTELPWLARPTYRKQLATTSLDEASQLTCLSTPFTKRVSPATTTTTTTPPTPTPAPTTHNHAKTQKHIDDDDNDEGVRHFHTLRLEKIYQ